MSSNSMTTDTLAGIAGGVASVLVGQPLDTVKVKMQLFPNMYTGITACIMKTVQQQRLRGLYAGTVPALMSNCADNAVLFGTYGQCQRMVASLAGTVVKDLNPVENALAGAASSLFTSLVLCPTELVKIRMQGYDYRLDDQKVPKHLSVFKMIGNIWKKHGLKGMYRGLWATMARESVGCTAFFGTYEFVREWLRPAGKGKDELDLPTTITAGAFAGVAMWLASYPMDVIKSRVQMSERGANGGYRPIWNEVGTFRGLYTGLWPTLAKAVSTCSVLLLTVEVTKKMFDKLLTPSNSSSPPASSPPASSPPVSSPPTSSPPTFIPPKSNPPSSNLPSFGLPPSDSPPPEIPAHPADDQFFSLCDFVSGWIAGIVSTFVGHPIETIKIVQQVNNSNIGKAISEISRKNKFSGYFRGILSPILLTGLMNSVFFGVYGNTMRSIQRYRSREDPSENANIRYCCDAEKLHDNWHLDLFVSGCVGGLFYSLINIPSEVVKTILQATNTTISKMENVGNSEKVDTPKFRSSVQVIKELYKTKGIKSFYRGGTLLMIRDVPSMGLYVLSYEHLYCYLRTTLSITQNEPVPKYITIFSGGVAGILSWILFLPFDVIKSKFISDSLTQPQYKSVWDCVKKTYRVGGAVSFFRGFWLMCIRAFPVNGITFLVVELVMNSCVNEKTVTDDLKTHNIIK